MYFLCLSVAYRFSWKFQNAFFEYLTAAHCVDGMDECWLLSTQDYEKRFFRDTPLQDRYEVDFIQHPQYNLTRRGPNNDIALLFVKNETDIRGAPEPVCLPLNGSDPIAYNEIIVFGI